MNFLIFLNTEYNIKHRDMLKEKYTTTFNSYFLLTLASSPTSKSTNDLTNKMIQKLFHK